MHNATEHFTPESDPSVRPSVVSRPAPRVEDGSGQCKGSTQLVAGKLKQLSGEKMSFAFDWSDKIAPVRD